MKQKFTLRFTKNKWCIVSKKGENMIELPAAQDLVDDAIAILEKAGGKIKTRELQNALAIKHGLTEEQLSSATPTGCTHWSLRVNQVRLRLVNKNIIIDSKKEKTNGYWIMKKENAEKDSMPKVEKMIHPTLFYLATCGGWATQSMINDFLAQIFGVTEKRIEWEMTLGKLRAELIKESYILEPIENKKDIWELTNTGRIEIINEMMAFHFMWETWKKEI